MSNFCLYRKALQRIDEHINSILKSTFGRIRRQQMSLPKWIAKFTEDYVDGGNCCDQDTLDLKEALSIAWEALKEYDEHSFYPRKAREAMRRIEELGK